MKILFIDTETNGLPLNKYAPYTITEYWPFIIQISWQIIDSDSWSVIKEEDLFIKPRGKWNSEAERIHQIPESIANKFGKEPREILDKLYSDIQQSTIIVAHNLSFDKTVILAEIQRIWETGEYKYRPNDLWRKDIREMCTMRLSKELCGLQFKNSTDLKFPTLGELYAKLFNKVYDISGSSLHNSKHDVSCLAMCFKQLIDEGHISIE